MKKSTSGDRRAAVGPSDQRLDVREAFKACRPKDAHGAGRRARGWPTLTGGRPSRCHCRPSMRFIAPALAGLGARGPGGPRPLVPRGVPLARGRGARAGPLVGVTPLVPWSGSTPTGRYHTRGEYTHGEVPHTGRYTRGDCRYHGRYTRGPRCRPPSRYQGPLGPRTLPHHGTRVLYDPGASPARYQGPITQDPHRPLPETEYTAVAAGGGSPGSGCTSREVPLGTWDLGDGTPTTVLGTPPPTQDPAPTTVLRSRYEESPKRTRG